MKAQALSKFVVALAFLALPALADCSKPQDVKLTNGGTVHFECNYEFLKATLQKGDPDEDNSSFLFTASGYSSGIMKTPWNTYLVYIYNSSYHRDPVTQALVPDPLAQTVVQFSAKDGSLMGRTQQKWWSDDPLLHPSTTYGPVIMGGKDKRVFIRLKMSGKGHYSSRLKILDENLNYLKTVTTNKVTSDLKINEKGQVVYWTIRGDEVDVIVLDPNGQTLNGRKFLWPGGAPTLLNDGNNLIQEHFNLVVFDPHFKSRLFVRALPEFSFISSVKSINDGKTEVILVEADPKGHKWQYVYDKDFNKISEVDLGAKAK